MAEYIKREDIIKWIDDSLEMCGDRYSADQENMMELFRTVVNDCLPFADVGERTHGKWVDCDDVHYGWNTWQCSVCGDEFILEEGTPDVNGYNFCPNCGADMKAAIVKRSGLNG